MKYNKTTEKIDLPIISVIVPIYNVEKYVARCIKSVLVQTYRKLELILVDDGSEDASYEICKEYATSDLRIKLIHTKNQGVSTARNIGLNNCNGDFIVFLDSDDELEKDALEKCYAILENQKADVVIFGWNNINEKEGTVEKHNDCYKIYQNCEEVIYRILKNYSECGGGYPWNKIWRRNSLEKYSGIPKFNENLIFFEDLEWVVKCMMKMGCIAICSECIYKHYIRPGSITCSKNNIEKKELSYHHAIQNICEIMKPLPRMQEWFYKKISPEIVNGILHAHRMRHKELKRELYNYVKQNLKQILKYLDWKMKIRCVCIMILLKPREM